MRRGGVIALLVGGVLVAAGVGVLMRGDESREKGGIAILTLGAVLVLIGCYRIHKVKLPFGAGEIETHPQTGDTARYADQAAEPVSPGSAAESTVIENTPVDEGDVEDAARFYAGDRSIRALLTPADGPLADAEMHLYIFDESENLLFPVFEPDDDDDELDGWPPHVGVTGVAYVRKEFIVAEGDSAWNSTFGLDTERQERYRHLVAVAAAPVLNASDQCIAVLSASTELPGNALGTAEGEAALLALAAGVARILVDLLKWFTDDADN